MADQTISEPANGHPEHEEVEDGEEDVVADVGASGVLDIKRYIVSTHLTHCRRGKEEEKEEKVKEEKSGTDRPASGWSIQVLS